MASAVGNLEGRRPEDLIQATQRSNVRDGQGGDVSLGLASNSESMLPGVTTALLMDMPAVSHDVVHGVLEQRSSDICSALAGTRPRIPEQQEVVLRSPGEEPAQRSSE